MRDLGGPPKHHPSPWITSCLILLLLALATSPAEGQGRNRGRAATARLRRCENPPGFSVNGVEPLSRAQGHVTLVALLTSTCSFCIRQAQSLEDLYNSYLANGTDVHMMIVNGGPAPDPEDGEGVFERLVSFDVYHDDSGHTIWNQVFRGNKDDILVFNRCGKLTYHLPFPYSYLGYSYVTRAIDNTDSNPQLCPCEQQAQDPHDMMMGDAPRYNRRRSRHGNARNNGIFTGIFASRRGQAESGQQDQLHDVMMGDAPRYNRGRSRHRRPSRHHEAREIGLFGLPEYRPTTTTISPYDRFRDRMMGDAPRSNRHRDARRRYGMFADPVDVTLLGDQDRDETQNRRRVPHRCPEGDELCRELERGRRRYDRFRAQQGMGPHSDVDEDEVLRSFGRQADAGPAL